MADIVDIRKTTIERRGPMGDGIRSTKIETVQELLEQLRRKRTPKLEVEVRIKGATRFEGAFIPVSKTAVLKAYRGGPGGERFEGELTECFTADDVCTCAVLRIDAQMTGVK